MMIESDFYEARMNATLLSRPGWYRHADGVVRVIKDDEGLIALRKRVVELEDEVMWAARDLGESEAALADAGERIIDLEQKLAELEDR